jgi:hypothetical protein
MTHAGQKGTTGGNSSQHGQRDDQGPPHPSARLPCVCLGGHTMSGHALSHCTPVRYGRIASVSASHKATQFAGPHKISYAPVHNSNLLTGSDDQSLTDTGGGYHLGAPNFRSDRSPSFPSSILHFPLIAPSGLQLYHSIN